MNIVPTLYLAAILAGPLHAQVCSGGNNGGADATGNQCSDVAAVEPYADRSKFASPQAMAKMSGIPQSSAAVPGAGPMPVAKMSGTRTRTNESAQGMSQFAKVAVPPNAPVKTSTIATRDASPCSGGPNGGMDATGNECDEVSADAGVVLVANSSQR